MQYEDAKVDIPYVEIEAGGYLLGMLADVGYFKDLPMGGVDAITWIDLHPYVELMTDGIEAWEAQLIISMSKAFVLGLNEGKSPFSIAPIDRE